MVVERPGDTQQSAVHVQQVVEVDGPFLVVFGDLRIEHGVNRLFDDRRLEKGARIQADDGRAVVHGVEVVVLRFLVDRVLAPEGDVLEARQVDLLPFLGTCGVWPDENPDVFQPWIRAGADCLDPALDKRRFTCGVTEQ